jgi:hypothetical protein
VLRRAGADRSDGNNDSDDGDRPRAHVEPHRSVLPKPGRDATGVHREIRDAI